ncbi:MAG: hypothetical protein SF097_02035 [Acidobacteriota bacterium]|nr:hypothetical protein [Acidobacteriota bacterium]
MRTIFEDTEINAELEESKAGGNKYLLLILWCVAICFLMGTWGVYRWATNKPAPEPPPPPVSLQDLKQVGAAFSAFNGFIREGKWTDAEAMLSTAARQRLTTEAKTLSESLLGKSKDLKLIQTDPTPSVDRSDPNVFKQDFVYLFTDQAGTKTSNEIISLSLTIENGKIVINGWGEDKPQDKKPEDTKADNKKA